jgi:hypothetical protein
LAIWDAGFEHAVAPASEVVPLGQAAQTVEPALAAKVPAGHEMQADDCASAA